MPRVVLGLAATTVVVACSGDPDGTASDATVDDGDAWCAAAARVEAASGAADLAIAGSSGAVASTFADFESALGVAIDVAPDAIRGDVVAAADGVAELGTILAEAGHDVDAVSDGRVDDLVRIDADVRAATDRIDAYNLDACGGPSEPAAAPDSSQPSATSGDPQTPWCDAARELDAATARMADLDVTDAVEVEDVVAGVLDEYGRATPLAPPAIAADVELTVAAFEEVATALAAVDHDFLRLDLSVFDDRDGTLEAAGDRIAAYNETTCGIAVRAPSSSVPALDATEGSIRERTVAQLVDEGFTAAQADCIFDHADLSDPDVGSDLAAVAAILERCGIDLATTGEDGG